MVAAQLRRSCISTKAASRLNGSPRLRIDAWHMVENSDRIGQEVDAGLLTGATRGTWVMQDLLPITTRTSDVS
jgi:hypothetical protein